MSDSLGNGAGDPTAEQAAIYRRWAEGGVAAAIVGEVQTDPFALEKPGNLVLAPDLDTAAFAQLTESAKQAGSHLWAQLGHAGALAYAPLGRPAGPSALELPELACAGLSSGEVTDIPGLFASGARRAVKAGFSGVQIHAAHGFLLSQFLSPLFNSREDEWGGSLENRARLLMQTIDTVRAAVGPDCPVAVKLNCSDLLEGGFGQEEAAKVVEWLGATSVDLIEISGGTYFPGARSSGDRSGGEPYFIDFARRVRPRISKPLMTTGGFKTLHQASEALDSGSVDLVGLARALVLDPELPAKWTGTAGPDPRFPRFSSTAPGAVTAWYTMRLSKLAKGLEDDIDNDADAALERYERRDAARHEKWRARFGAP